MHRHRIPEHLAMFKTRVLTDLKGNTDYNMIILRDFNTSCHQLDGNSTKKKIEPVYTMDQMEVIDIHRAFHSTNAACISFLSTVHADFSGIDHI